MLKKLTFVGLMVLGLGHAWPAAAQADFGWTRLVNAAWTEEKGPSGGQCIDVPYRSTEVGTVVQMWPCSNAENQLFRLMDGSLESSRIAVYRGADERCLGYEPEGGKVNITTCDDAPKWRTTAAGELSTEGYCMRVPDGGRPELDDCNASDPRTAFGSNWQFDTLGYPYGNVIALANDRFLDCLDVGGGSTAPGASMIHYGCSGRANQAISARGTRDEVFLTVYSDGQRLCISNVLEGTHAPSTQAVPCNRSDRRQAWRVQLPPGVPGAGARLVNARTGRCLDAFLDSNAVGTWSCHQGANQSWTFLVL